MKTPRPLFVTGTARSGSNLLSRMLTAHPDAMVACDPYFPLFISFRNAIVLSSPDARLRAVFDPTSPIQDYYFTDDRVRVMDAIQAGDLTLQYDRREWDRLRDACVSRMKHECADLIPHVATLFGPTYKHLFDNALAIIDGARGVERRKWVGFKEVWTVEFFAPLAREYPDASFLILIRDPRAVVASMHAIDEMDASQVAHTLSYARHWRKYIAFARHYREDPLFANRLMVVAYEKLVTEPEKTALELCDFLEIGYDAQMVDPGRYYDFSRGTVWKGNSSFEDTLAGITAHQVERWRTALNPRALKLVEFVCGPEMWLAGYEPVTDMADRWPDSDVLDCLIENGRQRCSWRSDLGDVQQDYGFELFRRALLVAADDAIDLGLLRRSFLFEDVFRQLRKERDAS